MSDIALYLRNWMESGGTRDRPYFAIARASIMAQLRQYEAAGAILSDWLDQAQVREGSIDQEHPDPTSVSWLEMRARSMLAAFMEEWLRREGDRTATALRNEHLRNLDFLRAVMRTKLDGVTFFSQIIQNAQNRDGISLNKPSDCEYDGGHVRSWRRLLPRTFP